MISYKDFCSIMNPIYNIQPKTKKRTHAISLFSPEEQAAGSLIRSQGIIFGSALEKLYSQVLVSLGAQITPLGIEEDLFFSYQDKDYLIEMKTRDDHDSSAKEGIVAKFLKKIALVPKETTCFLYFVDKEIKNKKYYSNFFETLVGQEIQKYIPEFPYQEIVDFFKRYQSGERE